jgi:hypothetical protein
MACFSPMPVKATYAASKRFILDFSLAVNQEMIEKDVTITCICPGGLPTTSMYRKSIASQGIMGRLSTSNVGDIAYLSIQKSLAGKTQYIPKWFNHVLRLMSLLIPRRIGVKMVNARWKITHNRMND